MKATDWFDARKESTPPPMRGVKVVAATCFGETINVLFRRLTTVGRLPAQMFVLRLSREEWDDLRSLVAHATGEEGS